MHRRTLCPLLVLATAAAVVAGCGGGKRAPDPKPVAEAWVHALARPDFSALCRLAAPAVISQLKRYGLAGSGSGCSFLAQLYLPVPRASQRLGMRDAQARRVTRSGAQAEVSFGAGVNGVLLVRAHEGWRVAVPGLDERIFGLSMEDWCQFTGTVQAGTPLAPGNTRRFARYLETLALQVDTNRNALFGIEAPPGHAAGMRELLSALDDEASALRAAAALGLDGASRARLIQALRGRYTKEVTRSQRAVQLLHAGCGVTLRDPKAGIFRTRATSICRGMGRALDAIDLGSSAAQLARALEHIVSVQRRGRRALARLRPPAGAAPAFRAALALMPELDRQILRARDAARPGDKAQTHNALRQIRRLSIRAVDGFNRGGVPACRDAV